ncbi:ribonuclease H-like domain-containing protein [Tanacetum coccineum]
MEEAFICLTKSALRPGEDGHVKVQSKSVGNASRNTRRVARNSRNVVFCQQGNALNVQCYNCNEKGHYARVCLKLRVHDSNHFKEQILLAKKDASGIDLNTKENDFLLADVSDT